MTGLIVEAVPARTSLPTQARSPSASERTAEASSDPDRIRFLRASRRSRTRAVTMRRPCRAASWRASSRSMTAFTWGRALRASRVADRAGARLEERSGAVRDAGIGDSIGPWDLSGREHKVAIARGKGFHHTSEAAVKDPAFEFTRGRTLYSVGKCRCLAAR